MLQEGDGRPIKLDWASCGPFHNRDEAERCVTAMMGTGKFQSVRIESHEAEELEEGPMPERSKTNAIDSSSRIYPALSEEDKDRVVREVKRFLGVSQTFNAQLKAEPVEPPPANPSPPSNETPSPESERIYQAFSVEQRRKEVQDVKRLLALHRARKDQRPPPVKRLPPSNVTPSPESDRIYQTFSVEQRRRVVQEVNRLLALDRARKPQGKPPAELL